MKQKPKAIKKKTGELFEAISLALEKRCYVFTNHAKERSLERRHVTEFEVLKVLRAKSKLHEKRKDFYSSAFEAWNYSVRGIVDDDLVRIIVSFDEENMLIITVINLSE